MEGCGESVKPYFDSKFHFHRKFWINLINIWDTIFTLNILTLYLILLLNKSILLLMNVLKIAG